MRPRPLISALVFLLVATAGFAGKTRAVKQVEQQYFTYAIFDATTQRPVVGAEVSSGGQTAVTDATGEFMLFLAAGRPVAVTVHRSGYEDLTFTVTIALRGPASPVSGPIGPSYSITLPPNTVASPPSVPAGPQPTPPNQAYIPLTPRPPVTVKLTSGVTSTLDPETVQFAYVLPFATPQGSSTPSFCRADGSAWAPERSELAQIIGPAKKVTSAPCCKLGPVLAVDVKTKSGASATVSFTDSCFGYDIVLAGRDHETAQYVYYKFTDIGVVTFP
jgi:hypothetical protein